MITTEKLPQPKLGEIVISLCLEGYSGQKIDEVLKLLSSYSPRICYQDEYAETGQKITVPYAYLATVDNFELANQLATELVSLGISLDTITVIGKGHPLSGDSPLASRSKNF